MTEQQPDKQFRREFSLQRIYLKDVSFETPNAPMCFQLEWKPESNLNLNSEVHALGNDQFEVVLSVTVTTKLDDKVAYLAEVKQAGIFMVRDFPKEEMGLMIGSYCPNILFPFAREAISALVNKGSFPQLLLAPVNFDALYAQHMAEKEKQQAAQAEPTH